MKVSLIVTAAGSGRRFWNSTVGAGLVSARGQRAGTRPAPTKLFLTLAGKPVLQHALESFEGIPEIREILVTLPAGTEQWVRTHILRDGSRTVPVRLVRGGATRAESVGNALRKTSPRNEWILVHDGARPFPPRKAIVEMLKTCRGGDGILLARPVVPTLKRVSRGRPYILETIDRNGLFEAETPQLVRRSVLIEAYRKNPGAFQATDESSLVEAAGGKMQVLSHTGWNVKITTPDDLKLAEAYYLFKTGTVLFENRPCLRIGLGRDTHRLVEGRKFYLGGVRIPAKKGALGHSDGDTLLHAVSDAILGAAAAGDIGEWFSDRNPRHKNLRSEKILRTVLAEARRRGLAPAQVDTVVTLEAPRLGRYKAAIRKKLAGILGLREESVSIKAKTAEGLGPEGEGRAVTCEALVTMTTVPSLRGHALPAGRQEVPEAISELVDCFGRHGRPRNDLGEQ